MTLKILIDDLRADGSIIGSTLNLPTMDLIIRNGKTFNFLKPILKRADIILFLDHDLSIIDGVLEKNGYQLLCEMFADGIYPVLVRVITSNPVGRQNIYAALRHEGYEANGLDEWSR